MTLDQAFAELRRRSDTTAPIKLRLPSESELAAAEEELNISFHPDYRRFQLEVSDVDCGVLEPGLILPDLQPYLDLRVIAHDGWQAGVPSDSLPFCQDNGNYYFMDPSGTVRYWDHDGGGESGRRATFAEWIIEDWLFDYDK
jgi:SMI1-KNR4 cell-wall